MSLASRLGRLARSHLLAALSGVPAEALLDAARSLAAAEQRAVRWEDAAKTWGAAYAKALATVGIEMARQRGDAEEALGRSLAEGRRIDAERVRALGLLAEARAMVAEQERRAVAAEVRLAALGEGAEA